MLANPYTNIAPRATSLWKQCPNLEHGQNLIRVLGSCELMQNRGAISDAECLNHSAPERALDHFRTQIFRGPSQSPDQLAVDGLANLRRGCCAHPSDCPAEGQRIRDSVYTLRTEWGSLRDTQIWSPIACCSPIPLPNKWDLLSSRTRRVVRSKLESSEIELNRLFSRVFLT